MAFYRRPLQASIRNIPSIDLSGLALSLSGHTMDTVDHQQQYPNLTAELQRDLQESDDLLVINNFELLI